MKNPCEEIWLEDTVSCLSNPNFFHRPPNLAELNSYHTEDAILVCTHEWQIPLEYRNKLMSEWPEDHNTRFLTRVIYYWDEGNEVDSG